MAKNVYWCYINYFEHDEERDGRNIISTDIVPHHDLKYENGEVFSPKHEKDLNYKTVFNIIWKPSSCVTNKNKSDDEEENQQNEGDVYKVKIIQMMPTQNRMEKWLKEHNIEVKPLTSSKTNNKKTREIRKTTRRFSPERIRTKSKSALSKDSAEAGRKACADKVKSKVAASKHGCVENQLSILDTRKVLAESDESDTEEDSTMTEKLQKLIAENSKLKSKMKELESKNRLLELDLGSLTLDLETKTRNYNVVASQFTKVTLLNAELQDRLSKFLLAPDRSLPKTVSLSDKSGEPPAEKKRKVSLDVENTKVDNQRKLQSTSTIKKEMTESHIDPGLPKQPLILKAYDTDNDGELSEETHSAADDVETIDIQPDDATRSTNTSKTNAPIAGETTNKLHLKEKDLKTAREVKAGKQTRVKQIEELWVPVHSLDDVEEDENNSKVHLGHDVWINLQQWNGVYSNKDAAKFIKELTYTLIGNELANKSFTGAKSNRTKDTDTAIRPAICPIKRKIITGYYIKWMEESDSLFEVQKRDKNTKELILDEKKINSKLSAWVGEKSFSLRSPSSSSKKLKKQKETKEDD